jgi:hypothetical protein
MTTAAWRETYEGGSAQAEQRAFARMARDIMGVQLTAQKRAKASAVRRPFHAKPIFATAHASLRFNDDLPDELRYGWVQPSREYRTIVRLSNANAIPQPDGKPDLRGAALRVEVSPHEQHDLLMTNFPVSHARNARQFTEFAKATAGGGISLLFGLLRLAFRFGPFEVLRMLKNIKAGRSREVRSIALETFWSRGAYRWGRDLAVRFLLRPAPGAEPAPAPPPADAQFLAHELASRLAAHDVRFELCVQVYADEKSTPIEDTAVEWTERASPPIPVAVLTLPQQVAGSQARADAQTIDELAFNPWNTTDEFRPLGNLNRARKAVYDASSAHRLSYRWLTPTPLRNVIFGGLARAVFRVVNRFVPWHHLPDQLGLLNLDAFRYVLRRDNLIDTDKPDAPPKVRSVTPPPAGEDVRRARTYDGKFNDLSAPEMGSVEAAFGRNLRPVYRPDLFDTPNPVIVSDQLLKRETFIPAPSLNILAAAWIQFQVHDWVDHARFALGEHDVEIPLPPGTTARNVVGGDPEPVMRIAGNQDQEGELDGAPIFGNNTSHWWDSSEVYGNSFTGNQLIREGAKLRLPGGYLSDDDRGQTLTGFNNSWWLGLAAMHTLFAREHNVLCDELRAHYQAWDDERIFQTARLIVTALIAKIHTVEWTPAILATKVIDEALNTNWSGAPKDWLTQLGVWLIDVHSLTGIPKTLPDHNDVPFSLTEDFATVYRLHPLIPDDYTFYGCADGRKIADYTFDDIRGDATDDVMRKTGLNNVLYSFGTANPGAITLHNFPNSLRTFVRNERPTEIVDLAVADIVRTRRRGVPRYNDFLEGLHKPRVTRWEDLAADPESVRRLKAIYGDIDLVDTVVGLFGETPPDGFGFSDTAFRIFILMASRRIQSDRFLTVDFRPEIYSPLGMDWIANNGMTSVILRHCPELAPVLPRTASAFAPWRSIVPADFGTVPMRG